ncbi:MAG: hypothetical protein R3C44_15345 [Chloroflexota bacterium]
MIASHVQRVCGILGLLVILIGMIVGYLGVSVVDWLLVFAGAALLTYSVFTGERVLLFDRIRQKG